MRILIGIFTVTSVLGCTSSVKVNPKIVETYKKEQVKAAALAPLYAYDRCLDPNNTDKTKYSGKITYNVDVDDKNIKVEKFESKLKPQHKSHNECLKNLNKLSTEFYAEYNKKARKEYGMSAQLFADYYAKIIVKNNKANGDIGNTKGTKAVMNLTVHEGHKTGIEYKKTNILGSMAAGVLTGAAISSAIY